MPANLYRRGGTWYGRVQIGNREHRRSLRTPDRKIAASRLKAWRKDLEIAAATPAAPPAHTWEDAVLAWADLHLASLRPSTQDRYRTSLRMLGPTFEGRPVADLTTPDFHAYARDRMRRGASPATVRRDLAVASQVMRAARRAGWRTDNPVPDELAEIRERREPIQPVPLRLIAAMIRQAPAGLDDMVRFLIRTGCRQEEAGSLEWNAVDLARARVTFARTKTRSPRVIDLDPRTLVMLRQRKGVDSGSPYVFTNRSGGRFLQLRSRFRDLVNRTMEAVRRCGSVRPGSAVFLRAWRCHDLRHTHAIRALQNGTSIYDLARRLGHTTVRTTEMYAAWLTRAPK